MKILESEILIYISENGYTNQTLMSEALNVSIGSVNQMIKDLISSSYLNNDNTLTTKSLDLLAKNQPKNAIILSAGFGVRMIPLNNEVPKGLLEVKGDVLIERLIEQLKEVNINDIKIVVGFMKEKFEYLIDKYNIKLIVNHEYAKKNNYHSLYLASKHLDNTYVLPSDIYFKHNPFRKHEIEAWYLADINISNHQFSRVNRKLDIIVNNKIDTGNRLLSTAYINSDTKDIIKLSLKELVSDIHNDHCFFEDALIKKDTMIIKARLFDEYIEINTFEDYRKINDEIDTMNVLAFNIIKETFNVDIDQIKMVSPLKKGMTNNSFLFECLGIKYIMRIPGEGTDKLINRREEYSVFKAIEKHSIADEVIYLNPDNGYKITKYLENARSCDIDSVDDLKKSMQYLKSFHELKLVVDHEFNVFDKIRYYESLWMGQSSMYHDYVEVRDRVLGLCDFIDSLNIEKSLTHVDAVSDNFLFYDDGLKLIDWEYGAMQDPHLDLAMFCIYAMYDKEQTDCLINIYFDKQVTRLIYKKIYAYMAMSGLLWSNWCEFKCHQGIEFGEYSLAQYRYAKEFYRYYEEVKV